MTLSAENLRKIEQSAAARKNRANEMRVKLPYSIVYIPDATIYTRHLVDSEGEALRTFWRHKINISEKRRVQCIGQDKCRICKQLDEMPDWDSKWRFRAREVAISYAWIEKYEGPVSQYVRLREHVLLMGGRKYANGLSNFIAEFDNINDLNQFLSPEESYFLMKIESAGHGRDLQMGIVPTKRCSIPSLPETFPPLRECIYGSEYTPDPRIIEYFISAIERSQAAGDDENNDEEN